MYEYEQSQAGVRPRGVGRALLLGATAAAAALAAVGLAERFAAESRQSAVGSPQSAGATSSGMRRPGLRGLAEGAGRRLQSALGRLVRPARSRRLRSARKLRSLRGLQAAIIGASRADVTRVLGPPRASSTQSGEVVTGASAYWQASIWYYPLSHDLAALAIEFDDDIARQVRVVAPPSPATTLDHGRSS